MNEKQQILELIKSKPKHYSKIVKNNPDLDIWVQNNTLIKSDNYAEMIYSAINQDNGFCKYNNKKKFKNITVGFICCGPAARCKCAKEQVAKSVSKTKSLYTDEQKKEIRNKAKKTMLKRYGDENYNNQEQSKKTMLKKYGVEFYTETEEFIEKTQTTNIKKYGVKCTLQNKNVKQKAEETKRKKYGNLNNWKKAKQTKLEKYGNLNNWKKAKQTKLEKYGNENYTNREKAKQTMLERYGDENYNNIDQIKRTKLERYGNEHYVNLEKTKKTKFERYGNEHYVNPEKAKQTSMRRYGTINAAQKHLPIDVYEIIENKDKFRKFASGKTKALIAYELGIDFNTVTAYVKKYKCDDIITNGNKSKWEDLIKKYLEDLHVDFVQNTRKVIPPYELDFYLPEFNVAIEINGNLWHSELRGGKGKNYHFNKWKACKEKGIDLYMYFEDELRDNFDIIKSKIRYITHKNKLVIGARKCEIKDINYDEEKDFLNTYHIQGAKHSHDKTIGAFYNNELVAVFSWQKKKNYLEITRFATNLKASYPGLFSKMMKHMIQELNYSGKIVSFSNNGHSNGGVYAAAGFVKSKIFSGAYWYTKNYIERENRQRYMKSKIAKKFGIDVSNKTEWDLMQELGYDRIWDAGKIKWELEI